MFFHFFFSFVSIKNVNANVTRAVKDVKSVVPCIIKYHGDRVPPPRAFIVRNAIAMDMQRHAFTIRKSPIRGCLWTFEGSFEGAVFASIVRWVESNITHNFVFFFSFSTNEKSNKERSYENRNKIRVSSFFFSFLIFLIYYINQKYYRKIFVILSTVINYWNCSNVLSKIITLLN